MCDNGVAGDCHLAPVNAVLTTRKRGRDKFGSYICFYLETVINLLSLCNCLL